MGGGVETLYRHETTGTATGGIVSVDNVIGDVQFAFCEYSISGGRNRSIGSIFDDGVYITSGNNAAVYYTESQGAPPLKQNGQTITMAMGSSGTISCTVIYWSNKES